MPADPRDVATAKSLWLEMPDGPNLRSLISSLTRARTEGDAAGYARGLLQMRGPTDPQALPGRGPVPDCPDRDPTSGVEVVVVAGVLKVNHAELERLFPAAPVGGTLLEMSHASSPCSFEEPCDACRSMEVPRG